MATAATIRINLIANAKGLIKGLTASQQALHRFTNKIRTGQRSIQSFGKDLAYLASPFTFAAKTIISSITAIVSKLMQMIKWGTIAFAGITTALIKFAMDAQESENLFDVSMGNMADSTRKWSNDLSKSLGLNSYEIRNNVGVLKVMMESMGLTAEEATKMSKKLTELAYDLASFYNLKPDEAFEKLRSAISGEAEPMKRLGVLVNETTTKTWALNHQLVKEKEALTEAQKVMARYGVIMDATQKAQGDLKRTGGSLTNVIRSIKSNLMEVGIEIGNSILPKINDLSKSFRDFIANNKDEIIAWGTMVYEQVGKGIARFVEWVQYLRTDWKGAVSEAATFMYSVFNKMMELVNQATNNMFDNIVNRIKDLYTEIGTFGLVGFGGNVKNWENRNTEMQTALKQDPRQRGQQGLQEETARKMLAEQVKANVNMGLIYNAVKGTAGAL